MPVRPRRILFVCLGNICRSPTVEAVVRTLAAREAPELARELELDSAGTADYHIGKPPDHRSIAAGSRRGYDLSALRARQVRSEDFARFDLLLAMDEANRTELQALASPRYADRVRLFLDYAPQAGRRDVPDPYYGEGAGFDLVIDLAETGARALLASLKD